MTVIDERFLRDASSTELTAHFTQLVTEHPDDQSEITKNLLHLVEIERLPSTTLSWWFEIARNSESINQALQQSFSIHIRGLAIKHMVAGLISSQWQEMRDWLGGTAGILSLLAQFSVGHVNLFLAGIWRRVKKPKRSMERMDFFAELVRGLHPSIFPDAAPKTTDQRRFIDPQGFSIFAKLLPFCDTEFVRTIKEDERASALCNKRIVNRMLSPPQLKLIPTAWREAMTEGNRRILYPLEPIIFDIPIPKDTPGISAHMIFAMEILRQLTLRTDIVIDENLFIVRAMIVPLVKKAWSRRRQFAKEKLAGVFEVCCGFLNARPEYVSNLGVNREGFLYYLVRAWFADNTGETQLEDFMIHLYQHMDYEQQSSHTKGITMITWIPNARKYELFKIFLFNCGKRGIDLEKDDDLMAIKKWHVGILREINHDDARRVLWRIRRSEGKQVSPLTQGESTAQGFVGIATKEELDLFLGNIKNAVDSEKPNVEKLKRLAISSRDQGDRASKASAAIRAAVETGSLEIYRETIDWAAKRFIRDYTVIKDCFSSHTIKSNQSIHLLSGAHERILSQTPSVLEIKERVNEANKVILSVVEVACSALKEPSFNSNCWYAAVTLFSEVVDYRFRLLHTMQKELSISDDEVYDAFLSETLSLAVHLERMSTKSGYENLLREAQSPYPMRGTNGPLNFCPYVKKDPHPACLRFIDNFAKERDAITREYRISKVPAVITLHPSLPRGSTLRFMLGRFDIGIPCASGLTPFLYSRAEAVVLPNLKSLDLDPEEEGAATARGRFVEEYGLALQIYIRQPATPEERAEKKRKAWDYAVNKLSAPHMNEVEAHMFWKQTFDRFGVYITSPLSDGPPTSMRYPLLPDDFDDGGPTEWNPAEHYQPSPPIKVRNLDNTYLNLTIAEQYYPLPLRTCGFTPPALRIWSTERLSSDDKGRDDPAIREAMLVSALLYLDSKIKGSRTIFTDAFLDRSEARYQSIFLADEFLERSDVDANDALQLIRSDHSRIVPSTMLRKLAAAALDAIAKEPPDSTELAQMQFLAFKILLALSECDKPQAAAEMAIRVVLDCPDASSWHRELLSKKFLNRLSAEDAQKLMTELATSIRQRLEEQYARPLTAQPSMDSANATPPQPVSYVKTTTIKQLAQLLADSEFCSQSFAAKTLSGLIRASKHIDARLSVTESLFNMLQGCSDDGFANIIIQALESTIDIAGSLKERWPLSEQEWREAENDVKPPTIGVEKPIMKSIQVNARNNLITKKHQNSIRTRILLPSIEKSIACNKRWMKIFASKYGVDLNGVEVPLVPVHPEVLENAVRDKLPSHLFDLYQDYIIARLKPSLPIRNLWKRFEPQDGKQIPEDISHWQNLYGRHSSPESSWGYIEIRDAGRRLIYTLLDWDDAAESSMPETVQLEQVKTALFKQLKTILMKYPHLELFKDTMENFTRDWGSHGVKNNNLGNHGRGFLKQILVFINSKRTPEWQRDKARKPAYLPQTLKYRLWLLSYPPALEPKEKPNTDNIQTIAKEFIEIILELDEIEGLYENDLSLVLAAVEDIIPYHCADIACVLGKLPQRIRRVDLMTAKLAQALFTTAAPSRDPNTVKSSAGIIRSWLGSENEWLREAGRSLTKAVAYKDRHWGEELLSELRLSC